MKKIIVFILLILLYGCQQKTEQIVDTNPADYYPLHKVELENSNTLISLVNLGIKNDVMKYKNEKGIEETDMKGEFRGRALINEKGEIDKIFLLDGIQKDVDNFIITKIKVFKYLPGKVDGNPAKYKFDFSYKDTDYFVMAEEMPTPVGGISAIASKVVYPEIAKRAGIEGRVFVKALIDTNGNVIETEVIKGLGAGIDESAQNAVKASKFTPGKIDGKPVKVQVTVPLLFKLQ